MSARHVLGPQKPPLNFVLILLQPIPLLLLRREVVPEVLD